MRAIVVLLRIKNRVPTHNDDRPIWQGDHAGHGASPRLSRTSLSSILYVVVPPQMKTLRRTGEEGQVLPDTLFVVYRFSEILSTLRTNPPSFRRMIEGKMEWRLMYRTSPLSFKSHLVQSHPRSQRIWGDRNMTMTARKLG